jgi:TP901 family phage tail tape measure protein
MAGLYFNSGVDNGFEKDIKKMQAQIAALSDTVKKEGNSMNETFKTIGKTVGAMITVAAIAEAGKALINFSRDLGTALAEIATISKEVAENQEEYKNTLITLSTQEDLAASSAQQLAEAYYEIVSAGYDSADGLKVLEAAARAGTAGFVDAMVAGDGITTVLNAWGKSADEAGAVSDIFFKTVEKGKTTFPELGANIAKVAPIAASMGISFEETSAAIASLTKQGTKTPEALTQLKAAMIGMNKVLGDGWADAMTFQEGLQEVQKQAGGSQNKLLELLGSSEAVLATLALTGKNAKGAAMDLDAMNNSLGATASATEKVVNTTDHQVKLLTNNILAAFEPLGDAGSQAIAGIAKTLNEAFKSGNIKTFTNAVLALTAAFVTYKVAVMASNAMQKIAITQNRLQAITGTQASKATILMAEGNKVLAGSFKKLTAAFAANPIGLLVAGLTLAIPLVISVVKSLESSSSKISKIGKEIEETFMEESSGLTVLQDQLNQGNLSYDEKKRLISELNEKYGEYLPALLTENSTQEEINAAITIANTNLKEQIRLRVLNQRAIEAQTEIQKLQAKADKAITNPLYGVPGVIGDVFRIRYEIIQKNLENEKEAYEYILGQITAADAIAAADRAEIAKAAAKKKEDDAKAEAEAKAKAQAALDAKAAKEAADKAAEEAEKRRQKALKALELENQLKINEITVAGAAEGAMQQTINDRLLKQHLDYLTKKRKLSADALEQARTDAEIISTRIELNPELTKIKNPLDKPIADYKKLKGGIRDVEEELKKYLSTQTVGKKSWKDTLEIINGVNQLVNDLVDSFGDLDEGTKNILVGAAQAAGGLLNMAQGIDTITVAMSAMEKASVILAVIGAALQVFNAIVNVNKKNQELRIESLRAEIEQLSRVNLELIKQNALYEQGNEVFADDRWGSALAGLEAYNQALAEQQRVLNKLSYSSATKKTGTLSDALSKTKVRTYDASKWEEFWGTGYDQYKSLLSVYPDLIDAEGKLNKVRLQSIIDTADVSETTRQSLIALLDSTVLLEETYTQFGEYISSIFGGIGDEVAMAFQTMYESGDDAMKALEESFSDMIESFTRDAIEFAFLQPYLEELNAKTKAYGEQYASGQITAAELQQGVVDSLTEFYNTVGGLTPLIMEAYKQADIAAQEAGFDSAFNAPEDTTATTEDAALSRAGQVSAAITEETGSELVGRISAMMLSNERIANLTQDSLDYAMQNLVYMKQIKLNTDYLPEIAANTRKTYEKLS